MSRPAPRRHHRALVALGVALATLLALGSPAFAGFGFELQWGSSGAGAGEFTIPSDVVVGGGGDVFVVDSGGIDSRRIQHFDADGTFITGWGTIANPTGIGVDADGYVYAAEGDGRVRKYDPATGIVDGEPFGTGNGSGNGALNLPQDVTVDGAGGVWVADGTNGRVVQFGADRSFIANHTHADLSFPRGIVADDTHVFVSSGTDKVLRITIANPTVITSFGSSGSSLGQFSQPYRMGLDGPDLYVAERGNSRVTRMTTDGTFVSTIGAADASGGTEGLLASPEGVSVNTTTGAVYVADTGLNRIQRFGDTTSLQLVHTVTAGADTPTSYTTTGTGLSDITLDGNASTLTPGGKTWALLTAGTYSVDLTNPGTALSGREVDITCVGAATAPTTDNSLGALDVTIADGENVKCTFTYLARPTIQIEVDAQPNDLQDFGFTADGPFDTNFTLDDDIGVIGGDGTHGAFANFITDSGATTLTQDSVPVGWHLVSIVCTGGSEGPVVGDAATRSVTLDMLAGEAVTCMFTNAQPGSITIVKDALGLRGAPTDGQDFPYTTTGAGLSSFSLDDDADGTLASSRTFDDLLPGTYTVTEGAVSSWSLTSLACLPVETTSTATRTATIALEGGEDVVCTFTNARRQPDALGKRNIDKSYQGNNSYDTTTPGTPKRTVKAKRGKVIRFNLKVTNDGGATDSFRLKGAAKGPAGFSVSYQNNVGTNITGPVKAGTQTLSNVATDTSKKVITVRVAVTAGAAIGAKKAIHLTTTSLGATNRKDVVTFEVRVVP